MTDTRKATHITYYATPYGYRIEVQDQNGSILEDYEAGNSSKISDVWVRPDAPDALSLEKLKEFARQTAEGMAGRWNLSVDSIYWDHDGAADAIADFEARNRLEPYEASA